MADDPKREAKKGDGLREQLARLGYGAGGAKLEPTFAADDLRRRLRKQRHQAEQQQVARKQGEGKPAKSADPILYRRDLARSTGPALAPPVIAGEALRLEDVVAGVETHHAHRGKAYTVTTQVRDLDEVEDLGGAFQRALLREESGLCCRLRAACDVGALSMDDFVFMDVESTGLGMSPVFLIGVMTWTPSGFEVRQYLARDYAEESAALALFVEDCASRSVLVTFNGKSFDFPFLRNRCVANGVPFDLAPAHFDLLHECRRIWKGVFPDCKLQTLERRVCGRPRFGDIPGSEIPDAYHAYVRTNNARQIVAILKHNRLDLVTLADLMVRLPKLPVRTP